MYVLVCVYVCAILVIYLWIVRTTFFCVSQNSTKVLFFGLYMNCTLFWCALTFFFIFMFIRSSAFVFVLFYSVRFVYVPLYFVFVFISLYLHRQVLYHK